MPPKSTRSQARSSVGGPTPAPPPSQAAIPTPTSVDHSFDFMTKVPSPVTLPSSQLEHSTGPGSLSSAPPPAPPPPPLAPPPAAPSALPPSVPARGDPFAFMAKVPSPVTIPSSKQGPDSGPGAHVDPKAPSTPSLPSESLPTPSRGGDSDFDFLAKVQSPVMHPPAMPPPSQKRDQHALASIAMIRTGARAPSKPSQPQVVTLPASTGSGDPAFDFLAMVPSLAIPPPSQPRQGPAKLPTPTGSGDPAFDFLEMVPSLAMPPPSQLRQQAQFMDTSDFDAIPLLPERLVLSRNVLESANEPQPQSEGEIERITVSDSPTHDSDVLDMSVQSIMSIPESGDSAAARAERATTAALLACRLSRTPSIDQVNESGRVPMTLEERLRAAQDIIEQELDELARLRTEMNKFNDQLLQHVLVLRNVRRNFLRW